jgi:SOS-response transcriptional repressor LexA
LREIGEQVGLDSIGSVHYHLNRLEEKGIIVREPWQPRNPAHAVTPAPGPVGSAA